MHIKSKEHGGHFVGPISNLNGNLEALLFVYDTDLIHINIKAEETVTLAHRIVILITDHPSRAAPLP